MRPRAPRVIRFRGRASPPARRIRPQRFGLRWRWRRLRRGLAAWLLPAPLVVLAGGFLLWSIFAPDAPARTAGWWESVSGFFETGKWQSPGSMPSLVDDSASAGDPALTGRATVIDADTLEIRGTRIRLHAVDAPESSQPCFVGDDAVRCGQRAANALDGWIAGRTVACIGRDVDRYGRTVATCSVGGEDVGRWLVRNGHAVAYRDYGDDYVCDEAEAAAAKRGIWASVFVEPSQWRRLSDEARDDPPISGYDPGWPSYCW
jgi:endonuclease YncB( thermonuclease family)